MANYSAFDAVFGNKDVRSTARRKDEATGVTRTVRIIGAAPAGFSLASFADAATHGAAFGKRGADDGAGLGQSVTISGAAARSAVLGLGDGTPAAEPVPPAVKGRGRSVVSPETNGAVS